MFISDLLSDWTYIYKIPVVLFRLHRVHTGKDWFAMYYSLLFSPSFQMRLTCSSFTLAMRYESNSPQPCFQ